MRIIFAGSPGIAVPALEAAAGLALEPGTDIELAGIITNPDSRRGRHGRPEPTELGAAAEEMVLRFGNAGKRPPEILKPERLGPEAREAAGALKPDLLVSFAYGRIFGPRFLALFPLGGINIHPSLLPKYRGSTPIPQAILRGDAETGITIQRLAAELDSGDILIQERFPLTGRETTASLSETVARKAADLLPAALRSLGAGGLEGRPQNHGEASYCFPIAADAGLIDWKAGARELDARIRAYNPRPLCRTCHGGKSLYILEARPLEAAPPGGDGPGRVLGVDKRHGILIQTGDGVLAVRVLQYQAKKALEWRAFLNGARDFIGSVLGDGE
jgi:methionyl-tRNA formyltransferase